MCIKNGDYPSGLIRKFSQTDSATIWDVLKWLQEVCGLEARVAKFKVKGRHYIVDGKRMNGKELYQYVDAKRQERGLPVLCLGNKK